MDKSLYKFHQEEWQLTSLLSREWKRLRLGFLQSQIFLPISIGFSFKFFRIVTNAIRFELIDRPHIEAFLYTKKMWLFTATASNSVLEHSLSVPLRCNRQEIITKNIKKCHTKMKYAVINVKKQTFKCNCKTVVPSPRSYLWWQNIICVRLVVASHHRPARPRYCNNF